MSPATSPTNLFDQCLACPRCGGALLRETGALRCAPCGQRYPLLGEVPWLFESPEAELLEWQARAKATIQAEGAQAAALSAKLKEGRILAQSRARIENLRDGHQKFQSQLEKLLAPLLAQAAPKSQVASGELVRAPYVQGLTSYISNLFRDWSWGEEENRLSLECVLKALPPGWKPKRILALGSGASRLAYDLHGALGAELTVALDANPLLLLAGAKVAAGEELRLQEFPVAPKDLASHTVSRVLKAPAPASGELRFVLGDVFAAPFRPESFDLVLTPWLIDILPEDARVFLRRLNPPLKMGGHWVYFGSLAFAGRDKSLNYGLEELKEAVEAAGFAVKSSAEEKIPYLASPSSCGSRFERVTTLAAEKVRSEAAPGAPMLLPSFLADPEAAIPRIQEFENIAQLSGVLLEILALVDGKTSVRALAAELGKRHGMEPRTTEILVQRFLNDVISRQASR